MLSEATLKQLSVTTEDSKYDFDLSTIDVSLYEPLFRTLQHFAKKNIVSLGFNCSQLWKFKEHHPINSSINCSMPSYIETSIANNKSHYSRNIIELLSFVIPRSTTLQEIRLSNILFKREHIERLATVIASSRSIKTLVFYQLELGDEKVRALLNILNPNTLWHISLIRCYITGAITNDILRFIQRRTDAKNGIQSFEVSSSEFSNSDKRKIQAALGIENQTIENEKIGEKEQYKTFTNNNIPELTEVNDDIEASCDIPDTIEDTKRKELIRSIQQENESLEEEIKSLKDMINAKQLGDSIFAVGPGSDEFVKYLNRLENNLIELDLTPRVFP